MEGDSSRPVTSAAATRETTPKVLDGGSVLLLWDVQN